MLLTGEHAQEGPEHPVKTVLRFRGWELRNQWLFPDDELEFGDEVYDELTIRANGLAYRASPTVDLSLTLAQDLANERSECLSKRDIRNITLVLVELPGDEDPARQDDRFVKLLHNRGLADPGIAGDVNQHRCAGGDHLTEGIE